MNDHKIPTVKELRTAVAESGQARGRLVLRIETTGGASVTAETGLPAGPMSILRHVAQSTLCCTGTAIDRKLLDAIRDWGSLSIKQKACAAHAFSHALTSQMLDDAEVCEGCAAVLMWDCENVQEWSTDNDGVPLCESCMDSLKEEAKQMDGVSIDKAGEQA